MQSNNYQKLIVRLNPKWEDLWISVCFEHGASGIETIEETASYIIMAVYFTDLSIMIHDVLEIFYQQFMADKKDISLLKLETLPNENWLEAWKVHFHPIPISDQLIICPPWEIPKTCKQVVIINPGNGFGSGSHPSTVIALKLLVAFLEQSTSNLSILDVGTGSGILLIAAKRLGGSQLVGIDIDLPSIMDARNNFKINEMENILTICGSSECIRYPFDIVICNMMLHEITAIQNDLVQNLGPSGVLILSGFYLSQKKQLLDSFSNLKVLLEINDAQWGGIIMKPFL